MAAPVLNCDHKKAHSFTCTAWGHWRSHKVSSRDFHEVRFMSCRRRKCCIQAQPQNGCRSPEAWTSASHTVWFYHHRQLTQNATDPVQRGPISHAQITFIIDWTVRPPPNNPLRRVVQTWTRVKLTHLRPFVGFKKSRLYFGNKDNTNRPLSLCGFVVLNLKQSSSLMTKASERRSGCRPSITHPVIPNEPVQGLDTRASSSGRSCCFWLRPCFSLGLIWAQRATGHNFQGNSVLSSHLTSH